ncbi:MAG: DEAD/DEAH box helicase, partial [Actinobacteria bacterium]|nr:DEAD/DEAH box helicase [Actinomycetota bacterium]
ALAATGGAAAGWAAAAGAAAFLLGGVIAAGRTAARVITSPSHGSLEDMAVATADALHAAGMTSKDGTAVRLEALADGSYRARLEDVTDRESDLFATALEEVLSPLAQPRYVVPRLSIPPPPGRSAALRLAAHRVLAGHVPATVVYHAVPTVLGAKKQLATAFQQAWNRHVSPGNLVYTGSPEGAGILAAQRGDDPFAITTQIRTLWH